MEELTRLYFGKAAAEREVALNPDRFLETYLDRWNLSDQVLEHEKFLILGPKGSGKSAAAHYVALSWKKRFGPESVFFKPVDFDELNRTQSPLASLDKSLVSGEVTHLTDSAWRLFIGIRLLDSLLEDGSCNLTREPQVLRFVADLREAGLASDDYPQILRKVRERRGGVRVPYFSGEVTSRESEVVSREQLGDAIINLVARAETPNRHLLAIDGLDKAIGDNDAYWRTLASLVRVGDNICQRLLAARNNSTYILIMCRSDVFRQISFSDGPKIAADSGIHMDWGSEVQDPNSVTLWEYLAGKARVHKDHLLGFLPKHVTVGSGSGRKILTTRYLLDFTRYTPRDMSLLFNTIQRHATPYAHLTGPQVRMGADNFASQHLLSEIKSEAVGLLPASVIQKIEFILSELPSHKFTKEELASALSGAEISDDISIQKLGEYLFLQGAIGNYNATSGYVQFYHRRDTAGFNRRGPWILHTGLTYAMNIPFSSS
ncbi:hypothetical protein ABXV03_08265 [Streptomyces harbinensis]|uniref:P-loop ATPase, Sll1717 family n=1 Tax=Streptomyces harbinensis TaxID=1176198 RepID=UPI0033907C35